MPADNRPEGLLRWQWSLYPAGHTDPVNLALHALTVPLFLGGTFSLLSSAALGVVPAVGGGAAFVVAVVAQGYGHKRERVGPAPFRGPLDVVARLFVEQWVTFPRYVLTGGFARAWSRAPARRPTGA